MTASATWWNQTQTTAQTVYVYALDTTYTNGNNVYLDGDRYRDQKLERTLREFAEWSRMWQRGWTSRPPPVEVELASLPMVVQDPTSCDLPRRAPWSTPRGRRPLRGRSGRPHATAT